MVNVLARVMVSCLQDRLRRQRKIPEGLGKGKVQKSLDCCITWWSHLEKQVKGLTSRMQSYSSGWGERVCPPSFPGGKSCSVVVSWHWDATVKFEGGRRALGTHPAGSQSPKLQKSFNFSENAQTVSRMSGASNGARK